MFGDGVRNPVTPVRKKSNDYQIRRRNYDPQAACTPWQQTQGTVIISQKKSGPRSKSGSPHMTMSWPVKDPFFKYSARLGYLDSVMVF